MEIVIGIIGAIMLIVLTILILPYLFTLAVSLVFNFVIPFSLKTLIGFWILVLILNFLLNIKKEV